MPPPLSSNVAPNRHVLQHVSIQPFHVTASFQNGLQFRLGGGHGQYLPLSCADANRHWHGHWMKRYSDRNSRSCDWPKHVGTNSSDESVGG